MTLDQLVVMTYNVTGYLCVRLNHLRTYVRCVLGGKSVPRGRLQMTPCVRFLQDPGFQSPVLLCTQKQLLAESMLRFPSCCSQLVYSTTELSGHCRLPPTYTTRGKLVELPTYRMKLIHE